MIGTRVADRYDIEAQIGIGGMGIVYRAHDTRLMRHVVLKVIAPTGHRKFGMNESRRFGTRATQTASLPIELFR